MLLKDGSTYDMNQEFVDKMFETYGSKVDVQHELQAMEAWLLSNPTKRKTKTGMTRFINSWLARAAESGPSPFAQKTPKMATIRNRPLTHALTSVEWVDDPAAKEAAKQLYLARYGYYFDGEVKTA